MPRPRPTSPEHDAIAALIRTAHADLTSGEPYRDAFMSPGGLQDRITVLFAALAAVDGCRYRLRSNDHRVQVVDEWASGNGHGVLIEREFLVIAGRNAEHGTRSAQTEADRLNTANVTRCADELHAELYQDARS